MLTLIHAFHSNSSTKAKKTTKPAKPDAKPQRNGKKQKKAPKQASAVDASISVAPPVVLRVKSERELLAGAYWVLLTCTNRRRCVLVLPNPHKKQSENETIPGVPQVAAMLKHLGLQSLAVHGKMPQGQRGASLQRFKATDSASDAASPLVLVTTEHFAAGAAASDADALFVGRSSGGGSERSGLEASFAQAYHVVADAQDQDMEAFAPELSPAAVQQLQARLKLARQVVEIAQRLSRAGGHDADDKWAAKLARGADMADEDEDEDRKHKKKKRALSPDEQRLQALTDKLYVLLAKRVEPTATVTSNTTVAGSGGDARHRKEKLEALGLVTAGAAVGTAAADERTAAQTRWMDGALGARFGGDWDGAVRHGASRDAASLRVRERVASKSTGFLAQWRPNAEPADADKWGGAFGKACGHNEVVLQALRPGFPQEVLNSKVCSRVFPAPGNQGFDGCLEHLRLASHARGEPMTVWDGEFFLYFSSSGRVTWVRKSQLLELPLAGLHCLVPALRAWTVASGGRLPLNLELRAVQLVCRLGAGELRSPLLPDVKLAKRVAAFAIGGSARVWKQILGLRTPLEQRVVYESME